MTNSTIKDLQKLGAEPPRNLNGIACDLGRAIAARTKDFERNERKRFETTLRNQLTVFAQQHHGVPDLESLIDDQAAEARLHFEQSLDEQLSQLREEPQTYQDREGHSEHRDWQRRTTRHQHFQLSLLQQYQSKSPLKSHRWKSKAEAI